MTEILTRAGCFVSIILLGYILRRIGLFVKEDFNVISRIVVKITLTAVIITSFADRELEYSVLLLSVVGFGYGLFLMLVGYLVSIRRGREAQAFAVLNSTGCNIGNFVLPFAQGFLSPASVMAVSLFDVGNSFICLGGAFGVAGMIKEGNRKFTLTPILRAFSRSVPLITYLIMTLLAILRIHLPRPVLEFAGIIGNANAFLAMFMIGVGFQLGGDRSKIGSILRILLPRYGIALLLSAASFFLFPLPLPYRQALAILFLSPIASAAPAFTAELKSDYGLASAVNSISILTSITLIVLSLPIIL